MAKSLLRLKALKLRQKGISVKTIAKLLGVSRGSASIWVRGVILTSDQLETLRQYSLKGSELGRMKGSLMQKKRRINEIDIQKVQGVAAISSLSQRELLVSGLALYWAEGGKKNERVEFCNSDPKMIKFATHWLGQCFNVKTEELVGYIQINNQHAFREPLVKQYWSEVSGMELAQFRKTHLKKAKTHKLYENFDRHYGTFTITVAKSSKLHRKIMGMVYGLSMAG